MVVMVKFIMVSIRLHNYIDYTVSLWYTSVSTAAKISQGIKTRPSFDDVQTPQIPVIHNASVTSSNYANEIRELLAKQLFNPVRWVETVNFLAAQGVDTLVECGPGKVLAGLAKRIDKSLNAQPLFDVASLEKTKQLAGDNAWVYKVKPRW